MCLAVPGRIARVVVATDGSRSAEVVFPTARRTVSLLFLPEAREGDLILAQAGYAMRRLSTEEAADAIAALTASVAPEVAP